MSECYLARCQQDRRLIRREFNKWTKNILLQIGLETISKNHFDYDANSFEPITHLKDPIDFNPNQSCLFCINRREYLSNKKIQHVKTHLRLNDERVDDNENSPLDLSLKLTPNLHSQSFFDIKSDILPLYNPEEFLLSSQMNFDYLSQTFPNMNLFSTLPINQYQSSLQDDHITQLAKQMAYSRMVQEIEYQRNNKKSKIPTNFFNTSSSSILTESVHINHILNDIMIRMLNETFEEQIKQQQPQQTRVSRQGELLFVKKQNDDTISFNTKKQHKHNNQVHPPSSSSSSTSSISSTGSSSIHTKTNKKSKSNSSSTHIPSRRSREIILNTKVNVGMNSKQIRPKRGQYRRYESEQLAKAVAAVLKNEMSVHKAGSYFGVPHSTLEYKVKERNSKVSIATKTKNESLYSTSPMVINDDNDDISQNKSMKCDDGNETPNLVQLHPDTDDEEIQLYIPTELEMN